MTAAKLANDNNEKTDTAAPMLPIEKKEPTLPIEPTDPTLPMESTDPFEPMERNESVDAMLSFEVLSFEVLSFEFFAMPHTLRAESAPEPPPA